MFLQYGEDMLFYNLSIIFIMLLARLSPVCTGMNLKKIVTAMGINPLPRMHGDEPSDARQQELVLISPPYARG